MTTQWDRKQKDLTRKIIHTVDIVAFLVQSGTPKKGCPVIHGDGRRGYITLDDALNYRYRILDHVTNGLIIHYPTVEELIDGGWKVVEEKSWVTD